MITFLICLLALVASYFTYGKYLETTCGIDHANPVPSQTMYDGVDYIPMPRWKIFLIQLLNIAGLGPIFGALLGAAYGPVAFLWITLGKLCTNDDKSRLCEEQRAKILWKSLGKVRIICIYPNRRPCRFLLKSLKIHLMKHCFLSKNMM